MDEILADEQVSSLNTPGDVLWPLTDNQGTVRDLATYDAQLDVTTIANHRTYGAYGQMTGETNSAVDCVFGYTGRLFDEATGLQNNLNRWYDAGVGKWLSEDPVEYKAGDANLYRYCGNDPVSRTDPSGLDGEQKAKVDGYPVVLGWSQGVKNGEGDTGEWGQPENQSSGSVQSGNAFVTTAITIFKTLKADYVCNSIAEPTWSGGNSGWIRTKVYISAPGCYDVRWRWEVTGNSTATANGATVSIAGVDQWVVNVQTSPFHKTGTKVTPIAASKKGWYSITRYYLNMGIPPKAQGVVTVSGTIRILSVSKTGKVGGGQGTPTANW